jgi:high-affinity K+ transport system ATPase subunit B
MATKVEMAAEDLVYALMDEAKLTEAQEQALHQSGAVDRAIVIARTRVAAELDVELASASASSNVIDLMGRLEASCERQRGPRH